MKYRPIKIIVVLAAIAVTFAILWVFSSRENEQLKVSLASKTDIVELFNHQKSIWLANLEWCESNGIPLAVNPMDRDGTPSFGAFQFKPGTFKFYREKYGLEGGSLMDYEDQLEIMKLMLDDLDVKWDNEFPACIKKIGWPPKSF